MTHALLAPAAAFRLALDSPLARAPGRGRLYALVLAWPRDLKLVIRSLGPNPASPLKQSIASLKLLGAKQAVEWMRGHDGLRVTLPAAPPVPGVMVLKLSLR